MELDREKIFAVDRAITGVIYLLLGLAALILLFAGASAPQAADLGDGYHISYKDMPSAAEAAPTPRKRWAVVPFPVPKPEELEALQASEADNSRRTLLLRCSSYYTIAFKAMENISEEEAGVYRVKAIVAMKESMKPGIAGPNWNAESERIFKEMMQEYVNGTVDISDRYDETCKRVTRGLK